MMRSRRDWIRWAAGALASLAGCGLARPRGARAWAADDDARLIVRSMRPVDLETPVEAFRDWATPNRLFFVRSHLGEPAQGLGPSSLEVAGLVRSPLVLALDDLGRFERVRVPAVLQCAGNGRSAFAPRVPGVPWDRGAVGNAVWEGVRLVDLLDRAGQVVADGHVHFLGADAPPNPKTPAFLRSLPLDKARHSDTIVATAMNGEPLPFLHGGPLRLIVPGWTGNHWMKWLRRIVVAKDEAPGAYQQVSYRMPRVPVPPGTDVKPADMLPITWMNVKSLITSPSREATLRLGPQTIRGVAWTGKGHVTKVEVSTSPGGDWQAAEFEDEARPYAWRRWKLAWNPDRSGRHRLRARATDSEGGTQPESVVWNKSGYLANSIDEVTCEVRS